MSEVTNTTVQTLSADAAAWFELRSRDNGETYYTLKDGRPDWLGEAVRIAHGEMWPDDYVYSMVYHACQWFADNGVDGGDLSEFANGEPSVYTADLYQWAQSHGIRQAMVNEQISGDNELGIRADSFDDAAMRAWYGEAEAIAYCVFGALEAEARS